MTGKLSEKVAIVTGAGSAGPGWGNGKATALAFARQGAQLMIADYNASALEETRALIQAEGFEVTASAVDVTDSEACRGLVGACISAYGRADILFNNVGGSAPGGPVELSETEWHDQLDHNLNHVFYMCKHALPHMERHGRGVILNMASVAALRYIGYPHVAYSATKAAVIQMTRAMGVQYAPRGIRCNTIVPGLMHTPLVEARLANQRKDGDAQSLIDERNNAVPMGKMGDAWDVANAAVFLASDDAKYITATELVIDGGLIASI